MTALIVLLIVAFVVLVILFRTVRIIPQARAAVVERLGRYSRTLNAGLHIVVPFVDRVRHRIDLREQVVSFDPQPVITEDNLVVSIDSVIYFQVTDPKAASYEIADYIQAIEQLTITTLRNVSGGMTLEVTLTSRDQINAALRGVLDEATGKWGIRVNRVELKAIEPPRTIQEAMEKQMRADRDKRAVILQAEGGRQAQILGAEGEKISAILRAEGERQASILRAEAQKQADILIAEAARQTEVLHAEGEQKGEILRAEGQRQGDILRAQGEAKAIEVVFAAVHAGDADQKLLAYEYLQKLPEIAQGDANKVWIVPSEFVQALGGLGSVLGVGGDSANGPDPASRRTPPATPAP